MKNNKLKLHLKGVDTDKSVIDFEMEVTGKGLLDAYQKMFDVVKVDWNEGTNPYDMFLKVKQELSYVNNTVTIYGDYNTLVLTVVFEYPVNETHYFELYMKGQCGEISNKEFTIRSKAKSYEKAYERLKMKIAKRLGSKQTDIQDGFTALKLAESQLTPGKDYYDKNESFDIKTELKYVVRRG